MQILLYAIIAILLFFVFKKVWLVKSITHYSPVDASQKIRSGKNSVLLDVRTPGERKERSIKGSFHIPLTELNSRDDELKRFRNREIICYCSTGSRSLNAASKLKKRGFAVANLKGGMIQWKAAGLR